MKIKRYFAKDIRQAIRMVRDEQGPDAVILSNRQVEGGIEIVAAVDYDEHAIQERVAQQQAPATPTPGPVPTPASVSAVEPTAEAGFAAPEQKPQMRSGQINIPTDYPVEPEPVAVPEVKPQAQQQPVNYTPKVEWSEDPVLTALKEEVRDLKGLVESQLSGFAWGDLGRQHPMHARIMRQLMDLGMNSEVSKYISSTIDERLSYDDAWQMALEGVEQQLSITSDDILSEGGIVALVGPTGVGKTTTIAKLAARYTMRHGAGRVALITTDNYRIGAQEQLRTYGNILGASVYVAKDYDELESIINTLQDKELVLIDTAGMSQRDVRLTEQLSVLRSTLRDVKSYLVLSATTQAYGLDESVKAFQGVGLEGCILTKLDEAVSLGEALSTVMKYSLPIAYISDGQQVPEDLHPARTDNLLSRCVSMGQKHGQELPEEAVEINYGRMVMNANV